LVTSLHFIIPLFKQVPERYREDYQKPVFAKVMPKGLVEAYHQWLDEKYRKGLRDGPQEIRQAPRYREEWSREIDDAGVRRRAKQLYQ
jgi:hypothetical protein